MAKCLVMLLKKHDAARDAAKSGCPFGHAEDNTMKVSKNFILRNIADEYLLLPTGEAALTTRGLIALSESGCLLYKKLQEDCSRDDLIHALCSEYDVTEEVAGADVDAFLDQMRQLNMLVEV